MLTTGRQLFHYNVGTMTRRTDLSKLNKAAEETLRIHPGDARRVGLRNGDLVEVESRRGAVTVRAEVTRASNRGTVFMTFHFPESRTNLLTGDGKDEFTGCPEYKVCAVRLTKVAGAGHPPGPTDATASRPPPAEPSAGAHLTRTIFLTCETCPSASRRHR